MTKQATAEELAEQYAEVYDCPADGKNYCKHDVICAFKAGYAKALNTENAKSEAGGVEFDEKEIERLKNEKK